MSQAVRTRFAPSPTGYLHVGGIRTALFAWLVARQNNGQFVLRLEDTDKKREVAGADQHIIDSLQALGLDHDEGPFRQSERLANYKQWAQKLIAAGRAYADPYSPAEVQAFREQAQAAKQPFLYRNHRPTDPPKWDGSQPLRFKSDPKAYRWHDAVMGDLSTGPEVIDDIVLIKSDGYPTYNFAHIIDDVDMHISHIIRGQEFLASMPNYLNLYEALGIEKPVIATVPHILGPDGKKKLSKRDGAKDVLDYIRDGYLPDALISFIATMGWNDGTTQEVFTRQELISKFRLERVQKSGAKFDEQRLLWINGSIIRNLPLDELYQKVADHWPDEAQNADDDYKKAVLSLVQERLKLFNELPELTSFFFSEPKTDLTLIDNNKKLKEFSHQELADMLEAVSAKLEQTDFTAEQLQTALNELLDQTNQKPAVLFSLVRIATTWAAASPSLADSLAVLGKNTVIERLKTTINILSK